MENAKENIHAPFDFAGGKKGVLLIHGFTGSPANMLLLGRRLAQAGMTVKGVCLAGHAGDVAEMKTVRYEQWIDDALAGFEALRQTCESVSVVGLSMGGTLALYLAERRPVSRAVAVAAALKVQNRLAPFARFCAPLVPYLNWSKAKQKRFHSGDQEDYAFGYPGTYTQSVAQLNALMKLTRRDLTSITCPLLVIRAGLDRTVHKKSADWLLRKASSSEKYLLELPQSPHVCLLGPEQERAEAEIERFLLRGETQ